MCGFFKGFYRYSIIIRIIIFFAFSVPNIIDLVLSIITYDNELKKYYILRYITQGLCCIYSIFVVNYITYEPIHQKFSEGIEVLILLGILFLVLLFLIPMEITCLVFFIKDFNSLEIIGKSAYFVHLITLPCSIFLILMVTIPRL